MEKLIALGNSFWQIFLTLPPITQWAVAMLLVCALIAHLFTYGEQTVHEGPSIFTTAGIFFTFLGIAEGLYEFSPQNIDASSHSSNIRLLCIRCHALEFQHAHMKDSPDYFAFCTKFPKVTKKGSQRDGEANHNGKTESGI